MSPIRKYMPELIKNDDDYAKWVSNLKSGDPCLVQQFITAGDGLLNSSIECWHFYKAIYQENRVRYNNDVHPINKEGFCTYWNSETLWGDVFPARLVPDYSGLNFKGEDNLYACEPIFEPSYTNDYRCVFFNAHGPDFNKGYGTARNFGHYYTRKVVGGELIVAFGDHKELQALVKDSPLTFLYAETT